MRWTMARPQPGPPAAAREERLEEAGQVVRAQARPRVAHGDHQARAVLSALAGGVHEDGAARGRALDRVLQDVLEHLHQALAVHEDGGQAGPDPVLHLHFGPGREPGGGRDRLRDHGLDVRRRAQRLDGLAVVEQPLHERRQAVDLRAQQDDERMEGRLRPLGGLEGIEVGRDAGFHQTRTFK